MFTRAIVRPPGANFAEGLTTVELGAPDYQLALAQHAAYCAALAKCGLALTVLPADERFPDSTFVEDTAVLTPERAIITRPGAASRAGETARIREALNAFYREFSVIETPGALDGGDICEAGSHFFIGLSARTNEAGARQLADFLAAAGYSASCVDIRGVAGILHLKSGLTYLGDNNLIVIDALAGHEAFKDYNLVRVEERENYAANCVRVNEYVLFPAGFPALGESLRQLGYRLRELEMSEFEKMDGGLSCLSLRF